MGSTQRQLFETAKALVKRGHRVTALTGFPNYPAGKIYPFYRGKIFMRERLDGIDVIRSWVFASTSPKFSLRLLNYLSFMFSSIAAAIFFNMRKKGIDFIYVDSPPVFNGIAGYVIGKLTNSPFQFNVADLWPQVPKAQGAIQSQMIYDLSMSLVNFLYQSASLITIVTRGFRQEIESSHTAHKIHHLPLGTNLEQFNPCIEKSVNFIKKHDLENKFIIMYAGNHGRSQGLESALRAADVIRDKEDIVFVFVGDGLEKPALIHAAEKLGLTNVRFVDTASLSEMPQISRTAHLHMVLLQKLDHFKVTIPAKIYEIMALGKPIVGALEGEARRLIEQAAAGICVEPGNPELLARAILDLYHNRSRLERLGKAGYDYAASHFSYDIIAEKLEKLYMAGVKKPLIFADVRR